MSRYRPEPWGICQRSGHRVPLSMLVRDGQNPSLLVHPRWYEEKHPQELPFDASEDLSVHDASPDIDAGVVSVPTDFGLFSVVNSDTGPLVLYVDADGPGGEPGLPLEVVV